MSISPFSKITSDLHYEIFRYLNRSDIPNVSIVCKKFYDSIQNDERFWQNLALKELKVVPEKLSISWKEFYRQNLYFKNKTFKVYSIKNQDLISYYNDSFLLLQESGTTANNIRFFTHHLGYITTIFYNKICSHINNPKYKLISAATDCTVRLWSIDIKTKIVDCDHILFNKEGMVTALEYSHPFLFCGTENGTISVWDLSLSPPKLCEPLKNHKSRITCLQSSIFQNTFIKLFSGSVEGIVSRWAIYSQAERLLWETLKGHTGEITSLSYDDFHGNLFTASIDKTICIWDTNKYNNFGCLQKIKHPEPEAWITCLLKIRYIGFFISGSTNGNIHIWKRNPKTTQWELYTLLLGNTNSITYLNIFWDQSQKIVSLSNDHLFKIWSMPINENEWVDSFKRAVEIHPILDKIKNA